MKPLKIAIIGAGSAQFSAGLVRDLCVTPSLHNSHISFMDIHEDRLMFITAMAKKLSAELGADLTFDSTLDRAKCLDGADYVINTAQDQCHEWSEAQRDIAERHGYYRGAKLHALTQMAFLLEVAQDIERICPNAYLLQSSNPVFEGCTLITRETKVKTIGLCHGHYGYRDIARVLGLDLQHVKARATGFNHWIWLTEFRYKGEDAYPLIDKWIEEESEEYWKKDRSFADQQMSKPAIEMYKMFGLMPIGDTPRVCDNPRSFGWWYHTSLATKQNYYGSNGGFDSEIGWTMYLEGLNKNLDKIRRAASDDTAKVSEFFPPKLSQEQIVPIIESIEFDIQRLYQVNIPNKGHILPGYPEDLVIECEALIDAAGVHPVKSPALPEFLCAGAMNPRHTDAELMVEAVRSGRLDAYRLLLLADHRTTSVQQVDGLLKEWLEEPRNSRIRNALVL